MTVTVWVCSPGCRVKSTRMVCPTSTSTPLCSVTRKPFASARIVYVPGVTFTATYCPALSVVKGRETPRATSSTVTAAPGITPPVWSKTVPWMLP